MPLFNQTWLKFCLTYFCLTYVVTRYIIMNKRKINYLQTFEWSKPEALNSIFMIFEIFFEYDLRAASKKYFH